YDSLARPTALALDGAEPHIHYVYEWNAPRPRTRTYVFDGEAGTQRWNGTWNPKSGWRETVAVVDGAGVARFTATHLDAHRWIVSGWRDYDARGRATFACGAFYAVGADVPKARPAGRRGP